MPNPNLINLQKPTFNNGKTTVIKVPTILVDRVKYLTRLMDEGLIEVQVKEGVNLDSLVVGYRKGICENGYQAGEVHKLIGVANVKVDSSLLLVA